MSKAAKTFVQTQYNFWLSKQVSMQLNRVNNPAGIKITSKLSDLNPLHASWIVHRAIFVGHNFRHLTSLVLVLVACLVKSVTQMLFCEIPK